MMFQNKYSPIKLIASVNVLILVSLLSASALGAKPAKSSLETTVDATASKRVKAKKQSTLKKTMTVYKVKKGDFLGGIAIAHGINLDELMKVNGIDTPDKINEGLELIIPGDSSNGVISKRGVTIKVPKGIPLSRIAKLYGTSTKSIIRANKHIKNPDHVRAGDKLFIPGAQKIVELVPPPPCFKAPIEFYRVRTDDTKSISLCFCNGKPNPKGIDQLSAISGPKGTENPFPLHTDLILMLQRVAEQFPEKRIEIVSGQRVRKNAGHESYHNKGRAVDFRVQGISNKTLVNYLRTFKKAGVGYYPNSVFVHMDARDKKAYWVDYSRPGEKAIYGRAGMTKDQVEEIRKKRDEKRAAAEEESQLSSKSAQGTQINPIPVSIEKTEETAQLVSVAPKQKQTS